MKKRISLAAVVMLCTLATSGFRSASGFEGTWTAAVPGPSGQSGLAVTFNFHVDGDKPSGTVATEKETFALVDLKINGSSITFAVEGEEQNRYAGSLDGDTIKMQVKYPSHENGTRTWAFVMKRASPADSVSSIEGPWQGDVPRGGGRTVAARFNFHADGAVLNGEVQAVGDDFPIVKGTIAGASIAFKVGGTQGDYTGTVAADRIEMKVKYDGGESGRQTLPFVLTRIPGVSRH